MTDEEIERITRMLHDAYERAAVASGWETQVISRKSWEEVPEANKLTMLTMAKEVLPKIHAEWKAEWAKEAS